MGDSDATDAPIKSVLYGWFVYGEDRAVRDGSIAGRHGNRAPGVFIVYMGLSGAGRV